MAETLMEYKTINNNVLYFMQKHIEPNPDGKVVKSALYEDYTKRCRAWNLMPIGEPLFAREIARQLRDAGVKFKDGKKEIVYNAAGDLRRANCYCGFTLVEEKPEADSPDPPPRPLPASGVP
jgi:hypothetical protein